MNLPANLADLISATIPTEAQMAQLSTARRERRGHPAGREKALQNTTKLSDWLARCQQAGIPYIEAHFSPEILVDEMIAALDGKGPSPSLENAVKWLEERQTSATMWRWDQCAPSDVKCAVQDQRPIPANMPVCIDDPRLIDILFEINCSTTAIALRPIVQPQKHAGFPVEFRCYVDALGRVAVSNYYPQMSLPESFYPQAQAAGELAKLLHPLVRESFTADFLLTPEGELKFLEGGPAWGQGAHPCCFSPADLKPGRILLGPEPGSVES